MTRRNIPIETIPESASAEREQPAEFRIVDKRHFLDPEATAEQAPVEEKPRYPSFVEELRTRLAETERRFEERKKQFEAEIAKVKGRLEADYERRLQIEKQKLLLPFLDVLDNLERALDAAETGGEASNLSAGVAMTADLFRAKLLQLGVEAIEVVGQPFDPNLGQAVGVVDVEDEQKDGIVIDEALRGYRIGEQLLRPAQVRVGRFSSSKT